VKWLTCQLTATVLELPFRVAVVIYKNMMGQWVSKYGHVIANYLALF
jgi:hypothetical protein